MLAQANYQRETSQTLQMQIDSIKQQNLSLRLKIRHLAEACEIEEKKRIAKYTKTRIEELDPSKLSKKIS